MHNNGDMIGKKFGRLTVIIRVENYRKKKKWSCICECGNVVSVIGTLLVTGKQKSCGCLTRENLLRKVKKHGLTKTAEHRIWVAMKTRCNNANFHAYKYYGARGIKVCERWMNSFESFLSDMGERPSDEHSIDRIDPNGNYDPENCKWSTRGEQSFNRRKLSGKNEHKGIYKNKNRWAVYIGKDNKHIYVGLFEKLEDAIKAREEAEIKHWNKEPS